MSTPHAQVVFIDLTGEDSQPSEPEYLSEDQIEPNHIPDSELLAGSSYLVSSNRGLRVSGGRSRTSRFREDRLDLLVDHLRPYFHYQESSTWMPLNTASWDGKTLTTGVCVELRCGRLLRITSFLERRFSNEIYIVGERYDKMSVIGNMFDHNSIEVCLIHDLIDGEEINSKQSSLFITSIGQILNQTCIQHTNCITSDADVAPQTSAVEKSAYVCRAKRITSYLEHYGDEDDAWSLAKTRECAIMFLTHEECASEGFSVRNEGLRDDFRGLYNTMKKGSASGVSLIERQRYTDERDLHDEAKRRLRYHANPDGIWARQTAHWNNIQAGSSSPLLWNGEMTGPVEDFKLVSTSRSAAADPNRTIDYTHDSDSEPQYEDDDSDCHSYQVGSSNVSPMIIDADIQARNETDSFWRFTEMSLRTLVDPHIRRYTFGDAFCGAGGASRGASAAGLCLSWAFDSQREMCQSYWQNFPWVQVANAEAYDFAVNDRYGWMVDVLHLSPPCNFYSPAHTINGRGDEANVAASFVIGSLLRKVKPRIVTLEQTMGLSNEKHLPYRDAVIRQFISCGYSIRWKVLNLADYGVPQSRQRFIILGSCPGETLPTFPQTTHQEPAGWPGGWNAVNNAIKGTIPDGWSLHDVEHARRLASCGDRKSFNGDTTLAKTLTTKGGNCNHHPSGERCYTARELAMLQTFPIWHNFEGTEKITKIKEQIGNAVPPIFAKTLYEHIVAQLRKADGLS